MVYATILKKRAEKSTRARTLHAFGLYEIIGKPLVTEKAYKQIEAQNVYSFRVHATANKNDVKVALEKIYGVVPLSVRVVCVPPKARTQRKLVRRAYKKAFVTLKTGDKIEIAA